MRSKGIILLFLFLLNCASREVEEVKFYPLQKNGCSQYSGKERINCINELLKDIENMYNTAPNVEIVSKERKNDRYVVVTKKYCHGANLCFETKQTLLDPTLFGEIKYFIIVSFPSILVGVIAGLSV